MSYLLQDSLGPTSTPRVVQILIGITVVMTLLFGLTEHLIRYLTGIPSLSLYLSLSLNGLSKGYLWQLVSYVFVYSSFGNGLSLGIIIPLLFHMYLLWIAGTDLVEGFGSRFVLALYLSAAAIAGLAAALTMALTGSSVVLSGASGPVLALLVLWVMLNQEREVLLFLTLPVKALWLIAGYVGIVILIDLSQGNLVDLVYVLASASVGYAAEFLRNKRPTSSSGKIVPLHTSDSDDEEFLDAMLTKIARHGENSLSWREKRRLHQISQTKKKH